MIKIWFVSLKRNQVYFCIFKKKKNQIRFIKKDKVFCLNNIKSILGTKEKIGFWFVCKK